MTEQEVKNHVVRLLANQELIMEALTAVLIKTQGTNAFDLLNKLADARGRTQAQIDLTKRSSTR